MPRDLITMNAFTTPQNCCNIIAITMLPRRQIFGSADNARTAANDFDRHSYKARQLLSWSSEPLALRDNSHTFRFWIDLPKERFQVQAAVYPPGPQSNLWKRKWVPLTPLFATSLREVLSFSRCFSMNKTDWEVSVWVWCVFVICQRCGITSHWCNSWF